MYSQEDEDTEEEYSNTKFTKTWPDREFFFFFLVLWQIVKTGNSGYNETVTIETNEL